MTMAAVAGVDHLPFVLVDCVHRFGAVGDLFPGMLDGKVVHSYVSQLIGGCLEWLGHRFPKEFSLLAVCTDDMVMQFVLAMLIIDHLAAVHQCLDACNEILGVLSWPGYNLFEFSKMHVGVDVMCLPCWIRSRKAEAFALVAFCSSLLPVGIHVCMHF